VEELNSHVIVDQQIFLGFHHEVKVGDVANVVHTFAFLVVIYLPVVKDVSFADNLEVRLHPATLQIRNRDHANLVDFLDDSLVGNSSFNIRVRPNTLQKVFEVVDVADLRRYSHTFTISRSDLAVVEERLIGDLAVLRVDQVAADHDTGPTLACFAVNGCDVLITAAMVSCNILAELEHVDERRGLMVIEFVAMTNGLEGAEFVGSLRAEVVNFNPITVFFSEESLHVVHMVSVDALHSDRWEAHSDDIRRDVAEVEIEAIPLIAPLLERYHPLCKVPCLETLASLPIQFICHFLHLVESSDCLISRLVVLAAIVHEIVL